MSVYVGIDVHRKRSQVAVVNEGGEVLANRNVPNGGRNGDHGLIGGNGGVQRDQHQTGFNNDHRDANRNRWGGDGNNNRAESNRGRTSMRQPVQHRAPQEHFRAPQQHFSAPRGGGSASSSRSVRIRISFIKSSI